MATAVAIPASAKAIIGSYLDELGMPGLTDWAWQEYVKLGGGQGAVEALKLEIPQQPIFKTRFKGIEAMKKAGLQPVTVQQYLQYEDTLSQSLKAAGLAPQFWSRTAQHSTFDDMVTRLLSNNVSVAEAHDRVQSGIAYFQSAPPEVRAAFGDIYGVHGDGALTATFLDPDYTLPTLQKMQQTAFTIGVGGTLGVGGIGKATGEQIAQQGLSDTAIRQQLTTLGTSGLLEGRIGEHMTADQLAQGGFATSAEQAAHLDRITQQRRASAAGLAGETFRPSTATGVTSVGVAPT